MRKLALCVGINYPGTSSELQGCVNDSIRWAGLLQGNGYTVVRVNDEDATRQTVIEELAAAVSKLRWRDRFVFTYSGHGTWLPDINADEQDARDEALCMVDYEKGGLIVDDELGTILEGRMPGSRVTTFSDSCFSGTVTRQLLSEHTTKRVRFIDPRDIILAQQPLHWQDKKALTLAHEIIDRGEPRNPKRLATKSALFSGCDEPEVSYDAHIDGAWCGAFTNAALRTYRGQRYREWHDDIRAILPSRQYPQSPQLQASWWQRGWTL